MAFIRHKKIGNKTYCFEITSYWDENKKLPRQKSKYLGVLSDDKKTILTKVSKNKEKIILDFGDSYFLNEFIKTTNIFELIKNINIKELIPLIIYKLCNQSAMRNCILWGESNYIKLLFKNLDLSSQNISRILKTLGEEELQRNFFKSYLKLYKNSDSIIIDATSLPNQISSIYSQWGRNDGAIDKQFRFLCVVEQQTKVPLFYRFLPGNIVDVSTLQKTIKELELLGINKSFILIDAGYFSQENIEKLYELKIDFLTRLPAGRIIYKELLETHVQDLESAKNIIKYNGRTLFIKRVEISLFNNSGYAYLVLDPVRKGKEISELDNEGLENVDQNLLSCGIMVLLSSKQIEKEMIISSYYSRQSIEQIFGFFKDDLDSLPIRCHTEDTIKGYLFLQFLVLIIFTQLRTKLPNKFSVEQSLTILRSLKAKVFEKDVIVAEKNKNVRILFEKFDFLVPNSLGI